MTAPAPAKYTSKLHNASVLVLGGTSGIGYTIAKACIEFGCAPVTISGSRQPKLDAAVARLQATYPSSSFPTHVSGQICDLSDASALEKNLTSLLNFATSNGSTKLNHIINTAGDAFSLPPLSQITPDALHQSSIVRFYGSMMLAKLLASTPETSNPYIDGDEAAAGVVDGGAVRGGERRADARAGRRPEAHPRQLRRHRRRAHGAPDRHGHIGPAPRQPPRGSGREEAAGHVGDVQEQDADQHGGAARGCRRGVSVADARSLRHGNVRA